MQFSNHDLLGSNSQFLSWTHLSSYLSPNSQAHYTSLLVTPNRLGFFFLCYSIIPSMPAQFVLKQQD